MATPQSRELSDPPKTLRRVHILALVVPRGTIIEVSAPPTVRLPIFLEFNSTQLRPEGHVLLDKVGAALASEELGTFRFSIEGHSDDVGSEHYTRQLSARQ
jgi:outer membrane protein OmpA-like peptidoglycan-associated protein